jgi:GT2 family glycosyltransferase
VIPLHGGEEDIRQCLKSLSGVSDLICDLVVVDNASPDNAATIAKDVIALSCGHMNKHKIIRNETNLGFAHACNQGFAATTGDIVLFLNSDTIVPRAGLIRLLEALTSSGSIAAAGPYTNYSGHVQQIAPTYTSLDTLDLFANDFANHSAGARQQEAFPPVLDVDMLTGFCLAVKRKVLDEIGGFDERFGLGTFEDNDLCYRIRRAGYRLVIATNAYIHHFGSRTLNRMAREGGSSASDDILSIAGLMQRNERLYCEKWAEDLETGYASHLSGLPGPPTPNTSSVSTFHFSNRLHSFPTPGSSPQTHRGSRPPRWHLALHDREERGTLPRRLPAERPALLQGDDSRGHRLHRPYGRDHGILRREGLPFPLDRQLLRRPQRVPQPCHRQVDILDGR